MKRAIKFRIWDNTLKKMEDPFTLDDNFDCIPGWLDGCELMQFTGLLDKNGREIYEGDIIHNSNRTLITSAADPKNYVIKWVEGEYNAKNDWLHIKPGFAIEKIRPAGTPRYMELIFNQSQIEVIGNVHENPELL